MQQGSGTFPAAPAVVPTRQLHRQAMAVLGAVCALVVVACVALVHTGSRATLVQVAAVQRVPVMAPAELARAPVWAPRLEHAKAQVGQALAQDMRKLWADDRRDKTHDSLVNEDKDLSELRQVEFLKHRYEAIEKALAVAPMLEQVQGARAARPGELLVQNPRTGQRFLLYEYHVPGAGTSAEYLGGDGGIDSDYDAVSAPSDYFATDQKGDAPFGGVRGYGPADRHPTFQGEYHDYAGGDWTEMRGAPQQLAVLPRQPAQVLVMRDGEGQLRLLDARAIEGIRMRELARHLAVVPRQPAQMMYEYHVPGAGTSAEYLGGDGGIDSDYDAVSAPSDYFATDEKGDAPFGGVRGYGPADRHPTFQGEYHDYAGGDWTEMRGAPQQLKLIEAEHAHRLAAQRAMAEQILSQQLHRRSRAHVAPKKARASQSLPPKAASKMHTADRSVRKALAKKVHKETGKKMDGTLEMLAQKPALDSSSDREWGSVYEPKLVKIADVAGKSAQQKPLGKAATKAFNRWAAISDKVTSVYDPAKPGAENQEILADSEGKGGAWWAAPKFDGHGAKNDAWWIHTETHSKNQAF